MMQKISSRVYNSFYITLGILNCTALGVAAYLCLSHYWIYTDLNYSSFCAISRRINCDTVAQSPWSIMWGIPVAHYGLLGYLIFFLILLPLFKPTAKSLPCWALLVLLGSLYTLVSLFFSYISSTKIHSYCILCLICFAINFFLFYFSFLVYRRLNRRFFLQDIIASLKYILHNKLILTGLAFLFILFATLQFSLPEYWVLQNPPLTTEMNKGITSDGHPWIGAEDPLITIEEYGDYQCFQCAKSHIILRQIVSQHPETIRLVHRQYPLDHLFNPIVVTEPFHVGSGKMSLLAIYATSKGKFWEMNDILFKIGRKKESFDTQYLAEKTGIPSGELSASLSHPAVREQLNHDIRSGMKLRILATPTFVIDDNIYTGSIPPDLLNSILERTEESETRK